MYNTNQVEDIKEMRTKITMLESDLQELYDETNDKQIERQLIELQELTDNAWNSLADLIDGLSYLNRLVAW